MLDKIFDYFEEKREIDFQLSELNQQIIKLKDAYNASLTNQEELVDNITNEVTLYQSEVNQYMDEVQEIVNSMVEKSNDIVIIHESLLSEIELISEYFSDERTDETTKNLIVSLQTGISTVKDINQEWAEFLSQRREKIYQNELLENQRHHRQILEELKHQNNEQELSL